MAAKKYVPDAGDIVWLDFDPQAGREQRGHRPAFVISSAGYNQATGLMICCPMTTRIKGYPFEVETVEGDQQSVVLADQVKSMDWKSRGVKFKSKANAATLFEIQNKLKVLLQIT